MAKPADINLLRAKTGFSPEFTALIGRLRSASLVALGAVIFLGVIIGSGFFLLQARLSQLTDQKGQLVSSIGKSARKESLLLVLRNQLGVAKKILANQNQGGLIVETALRIVTPPTLSAISVNDKGEVSLKIKAASLDDVTAIIGRLGREVGLGQLKNPVLEELELGRDGSVRFGLSFMPTSKL